MVNWQHRKSRVKQGLTRMDYTQIFKAETDKLIELNLLPAEGKSEADNLRIIDELDARIDLMEQAIEELRTRKHSTITARDQHNAQLPKHKQQEIAERDMKDRQKKQVAKIDKAVQLKRAQAASMTKALQDANCTPEEIRAILLKAGLV